MHADGAVTRQDGEDRVTFLSHARNKALEPLHWHVQPDDGATAGKPNLSSTHSNLTWRFQADKVVFLNDVYFCAKHVQRHLAQRDVNMACGMDFMRWSRGHATWRQQLLGIKVLHAVLSAP